MGQIFLTFMQFFSEICQNRMLAPLWRVGTPFMGNPGSTPANHDFWGYFPVPSLIKRNRRLRSVWRPLCPTLLPTLGPNLLCFLGRIQDSLQEERQSSGGGGCQFFISLLKSETIWSLVPQMISWDLRGNAQNSPQQSSWCSKIRNYLVSTFHPQTLPLKKRTCNNSFHWRSVRPTHSHPSEKSWIRYWRQLPINTGKCFLALYRGASWYISSTHSTHSIATNVI